MSEALSHNRTEAARAPAPWAVFGIACAAALGFGLLAALSIEMTRSDGRIAAVWLPNALAVSVLLRFDLPRERLMIVAMALGNLAANLAVGDAGATAAALSCANALEVWVVVTVTRWTCKGRPAMDDTADLGRFFTAAILCGPPLSGAIAAVALHSPAGAWLPTYLFWVASDALSLLIITPATMVVIDAWRNRRRPQRRELLEWAILICLGTSLTLAVFAQTRFPLLFLIPPVVMAHAFRLGSLGTAFSTFKVAVIALVFTELGSGPINLVPYPRAVQLVVLEAFLASAIIVGLPVAAILGTRLRMTRELAKQQNELTLLADNVTDAILVYDAGGRCTYASPSTHAVLGLSPQDFVGLDPSDRVHPEAREAIATVKARLVSGASAKERLTYRRYLDDANGEAVYIEADCAAVLDPATGGHGGIVVSARDVTARVMLERKLVRATRHAENAARAKAQFLANMSHEIRTPMNGVVGFAELLRRMDLAGDAGRYAELIERSGRSMMLLLNDILDISKIESGELKASNEPLSIAQLVHECAELHAAQAERNGIGMEVSLGTGLPQQIVSDPLRLRQILLNLIGNAVKFTEGGGVEITVLREGERLAIAVEDSGIGIDPDRLEQIFDPFVQAEGATTRRFGGTGLGLSISRQLAELLGGSLGVDSMPGVGSRFTLRIPIAEPREPAGDLVPSAPMAGAGLLAARGRVLLAEDHDINRILVTAMLEQLGQEVTLAHDGRAAIEAACEAHFGGSGFDLILMDVQMPGCDGYAATRAIRAAGIGPELLPIVALTANAYPEDVAAALDSGMQAHLAKPLVFEDLAAMLARWLPDHVAAGDAAAPALQQARPLPVGSDDLATRWQQRRSEALAAVSQALRRGDMVGAPADHLARTVHKLAGTAGMFGEEELGVRAAALERALRAGAAHEVRLKLAQELLAAA